MRTADEPMPDALTALRASLTERLAALRGVSADALPPALLDIMVQRVRVPGGDVFLVRPLHWEQLRHEEGGAGRPVPYWARPWPSGLALARALAAERVGGADLSGLRVLELGCGLGAPSVVAARAGARVIATDGASDAVAFAAHALALNEVDADVAHVDWATHGDALAARGPFDLVLAADVLYTRANVDAAVRLWPRLVAPEGALWLADPQRAGARDALAAARGTFAVQRHAQDGAVVLHRLVPRPSRS